jgi:hypothetical protein
MESFSKADVAALLDVRLATGGLIEGRRIEDLLDSWGFVGRLRHSLRATARSRPNLHPDGKSGSKRVLFGALFVHPSACREFSVRHAMTKMMAGSSMVVS